MPARRPRHADQGITCFKRWRRSPDTISNAAAEPERATTARRKMGRDGAHHGELEQASGEVARALRRTGRRLWALAPSTPRWPTSPRRSPCPKRRPGVNSFSPRRGTAAKRATGRNTSRRVPGGEPFARGAYRRAACRNPLDEGGRRLQAAWLWTRRQSRGAVAVPTAAFVALGVDATLATRRGLPKAIPRPLTGHIVVLQMTECDLRIYRGDQVLRRMRYP